MRAVKHLLRLLCLEIKYERAIHNLFYSLHEKAHAFIFGFQNNLQKAFQSSNIVIYGNPGLRLI